jgi:hypothetical protein
MAFKIRNCRKDQRHEDIERGVGFKSGEKLGTTGIDTWTGK